MTLTSSLFHARTSGTTSFKTCRLANTFYVGRVSGSVILVMSYGNYNLPALKLIFRLLVSQSKSRGMAEQELTELHTMLVFQV